MFDALAARVAAWADLYYRLLTSYPLAAGVCLAIGLALAALFARAVRRGEMRAAFWLVAAFVAALQLLAVGHDGGHHIYRIAALTAQLRAGEPSLLLSDSTSGTVLPTFVYYSVLPYLPAVLLNLVGVPAFVALKVVASVALIAMAAGVQALIEERVGRQPRRVAYLAAILFLTANYVIGLWVLRAALAEIWVYCLVPCVTLCLLRGHFVALVALLFVQLCAHPLVFAQALVAELLAALVLGAAVQRHFVRTGLPALIGAVLCASPFWLPQVLWKDLILGSRALPVSFAQSFMGIAELLDPRNLLSFGAFLPLALLATLLQRGRGLPGRALLGLACVVLLLAMQTRLLAPIVVEIPVLNESLFVWRLMLPTSFVAFVVLVIGWPAEGVWAPRLLAVIAALATAALVVTFARGLPGMFDSLAARAHEEAVVVRAYTTQGHGWGVREFAPNYARLRDACGMAGQDVHRVSAAELLRTVRAAAPHLAIRDAPISGVSYEADGAAVGLGACRDDLIVGPLTVGAQVRLSEVKLDRLLWLRLAVLVGVPLLLLAALRRERIRRTSTAPA